MSSLKLVDKKVDKICKENKLIDPEIFYSPISSWFYLIGLITSVFGTGFLVLIYLYPINKYLIFIPIPYLLVSYFLSCKLNNSFAITTKKVVIINPNFPFRNYIEFNKNDIKKITIDKSNKTFFNLFLIINQNYVKIETKNQIETFYCDGLEIDSYEEIWTDKSLDSLNYALKKSNLLVEFNF
jgi:hypothetical protein